MQNRKPELLAPAGSPAAFYGAIHAGADAVYLGGSRFGARAYADNFSEQELISCIRYGHIWGRKVYLTVNTLMKEAEMGELYAYLRPFYEAGLDAVIVQDTGVFSFIREHFPGLKLHVSTQMTITGKYGAQLLREMGASRIVPARELSLEEIRQLKTVPVELETFVHGAMCYCYSGQCLFSSMLGERSGNRGRCAQPCRLPYSVKGAGKEAYPLSLKDMCTIELLPELIAAGIDSFKIEGRMKKPEYTAGVTAIYRKYIDLYCGSADRQEFQISREDLEALSRLYMRSEHQTGYYHRHNGKEMITLQNPAYSGRDEQLVGEVRARFLEEHPRIPVKIHGTFQVGQPASVTCTAGESTAVAVGELVQAAQAQPVTRENLVKQLSKLGNTVFKVEHIALDLSDGAFCSLKRLNDLRREAIGRLENALIVAQGLIPERTAEGNDSEKRAISDQPQPLWAGGLHVFVRTLEQLRGIFHSRYSDRITRLYIDGDLLAQGCTDPALSESEVWSEVLANRGQAQIVLSLPRILRARDESYLEHLYRFVLLHPEIEGFEITSMEAMGFLKSKGYAGRLYAGAGFYLWNTQALEVWRKQLSGFCLPLELSAGEQRTLLNRGIPCEKLVYGRIPMMVTANCLAQTQGNCGGKETLVQLTDRYQKQFPVVINCSHCMNTIYNSVPLALHREWAKWKAHVDMRLDFTVESGAEVIRILDYFEGVRCGAVSPKEGKPPFDQYTTGHEKRQVE